MDNICNPPLVWIGGSCYRKNPFMESTSDTDKVYSDTQDQYADDMYPADDAKEFEDGNCSVLCEFIFLEKGEMCSFTNFDYLNK